MNCNQPVETLSKKHFAGYHQIMDDYKNLAMFEQEMEVWIGFKESQPYLKSKENVILILSRIIKNKTFLGWNSDAEIEQFNLLNKKL
jgi:hypothetical protein